MPASRLQLALLVALGLLWRGLLCWLTPIPSEDGVNYLWMAEQFASGRAGAALSEVFPPLLPLSVAVPIWAGCEPWRAAQLVLSLAGALATIPAVRIVEHFAPDRSSPDSVVAGVFFALAPLPARFAAEVYTEPMFLLFAAAAFLFGLRAQWGRSGVAAALAFGLRPEVVLIGVAFLAVRGRRAWPILAGTAAAAVLIAAARAACGSEFDLVPKASFNWAKSALGADGTAAIVTQIAGNAIRLPWLWIEALGAIGVLAWLGLVRRPRSSIVLVVLGLAMVVVVAFVPRRRFLTSWLFAVLPLAMAGYRALPPAIRRIAFVVVVVSSAVLGLRVTAGDRAAEREVGAFLGARLADHETLSGDMTRVLYYAGRRPLPPRHFSAQELIDAARDPAVRFVALGVRRTTTAAVRGALGERFVELVLPEPLRAAAAERGILVLTRR